MKMDFNLYDDSNETDALGEANDDSMAVDENGASEMDSNLYGNEDNLYHLQLYGSLLQILSGNFHFKI